MSQPQEEREMEVQSPPVLRKHQSRYSATSQGALTHSPVTKTMIHVAYQKHITMGLHMVRIGKNTHQSRINV